MIPKPDGYLDKINFLGFWPQRHMLTAVVTNSLLIVTALGVGSNLPHY